VRATRSGRGDGGAALLPSGDYRVSVSVGSMQETTIGPIRERIR